MMKTLEQMCCVLNRLLGLDDAAGQAIFGTEWRCSTEAWVHLLKDLDLIVHTDASGMVITPLSLINSLISEVRQDGEYAIFRDIDESSGKTTCFFVARVRKDASK